jgi:hypothetical protein
METRGMTVPREYPRRAVCDAVRRSVVAGATTAELVAKASRDVPGVSLEEIIAANDKVRDEALEHADELLRYKAYRQARKAPPGPDAA